MASLLWKGFYICCVSQKNAAPVIAIILGRVKKNNNNPTRLHEACHSVFSFVICILFGLCMKRAGVIPVHGEDKKSFKWMSRKSFISTLPLLTRCSVLHRNKLHSCICFCEYIYGLRVTQSSLIMCLMWTILLTHGLLLVSGSLVSGSVAVSLRDGLS